MICVKVQAPIVSFRKGLAIKYWDTEPFPPPSTCYGFLLSLVGEFDRDKHLGCLVSSGISETNRNVLLRTVWRQKSRRPMGEGVNNNNKVPDYQEVLTSKSQSNFIDCWIWVDSSKEIGGGSLEDRVVEAIKNPGSVDRMYPLCLGDRTNLVNAVDLVGVDQSCKMLVKAVDGTVSTTVYVGHVGFKDTAYGCGVITQRDKCPDVSELFPILSPKYQEFARD